MSMLDTVTKPAEQANVAESAVAPEVRQPAEVAAKVEPVRPEPAKAAESPVVSAAEATPASVANDDRPEAARTHAFEALKKSFLSKFEHVAHEQIVSLEGDNPATTHFHIIFRQCGDVSATFNDPSRLAHLGGLAEKGKALLESFGLKVNETELDALRDGMAEKKGGQIIYNVELADPKSVENPAAAIASIATFLKDTTRQLYKAAQQDKGSSVAA